MAAQLLILLSLLISGCATRSQELQTDKTISYSLPKQVETPSVENLQAYLKSRKGTKFSTDNYKGKVYKFGDILIKVLAGPGKVADNYLEEQKKAYYNIYKSWQGDWKNYSSEIRPLSNFKVLIRSHDTTHYSYYYFFAVDNSNTKGLSGMIEYKKQDEAKAKNLLEQFLKKLKFR